MKNYILMFLALGLLIAFAGCDKDEKEVELTLIFSAAYDGQPLKVETPYNYSDHKIQFTKFTTYLSDLKLVSEQGDVSLSEVEWLNFTPTNLKNNESVPDTFVFKVPAREYTGISMGYGVKPSLNGKRPADFEAGHPLAKETEFWPGWKSYIFNIIEGSADTDNNLIDDEFLILHSGSDRVYREATTNGDIDLSNSNTLRVEFDLKPMFFANNEWWDLTLPGNAATSNLATDVRVATYLMDNFDNATRIK